MNLQKRLIIVLIALGAVIAFGTAGYTYLEGWRIIDSMFMTVITISTVGYGEVNKLDGAGKVFSMILVFLGMSTIAVSTGSLTRAIIKGELSHTFGRRKLEKAIHKLSGHIVLCGYGRCGSVVAQELSDQGIDYVVIESNPQILEQLEEKGILYVEGDASDEEVLQRAEIGQAVGLVTSVSSDADNVFIILSAREMNQNLLIIARAIEQSSESKLRRAGADRVVMPYIIGGKRMANAVIRPEVVNLIDFAFLDPKRNILMEQMKVPDDSPLVNKSLIESALRSRYGLVVIGIKKPDGDLVFNPNADQVLQAGDVLILMGDISNLEHLRGEAKLKE